MPGLAVDLVEADLFGIRCRRKQGNRTGHERKAQEAFPVGAGGHGILRNATDNQLDSICKSAFKASRARNLVVRLIGSGARILQCGPVAARSEQQASESRNIVRNRALVRATTQQCSARLSEGIEGPMATRQG